MKHLYCHSGLNAITQDDGIALWNGAQYIFIGREDWQLVNREVLGESHDEPAKATSHPPAYAVNFYIQGRETYMIANALDDGEALGLAVQLRAAGTAPDDMQYWTEASEVTAQYTPEAEEVLIDES